MRSIAIRLGIVGAIVVAGVILRPFLTGNAGSLNVGDCFDVPPGEQETIDDVQHHPCTDPHGAEVVFVGDYAPATDVQPTETDIQGFVGSTCIPAFGQYTGLEFGTATDYDLGWFWPTAEGWSKGDHKVICYAVRIDEAKFTESIKKQ